MRRNILIGCGALGALVVVVLLIVLVLAVVNGGSNKTGSSGNSSSGSQPSSSSSSGKSGTDVSKQEFAVGDTATMTDRTFSVNDEERNFIPPNQFSKPQDASNEFIRANVTITNTSNNQISFNPNDFKLQDANGVQRNYTTISDIPTPLSYGNLAPNGSVTGNLVFEAPHGGTGLKLIYKPNAFRNETVTVNM